jgi:response regulator RpfG family c-di-GMP phosphodiesterase
MRRRRVSVLLVDDEPLLLKALSAELEDEADVTTAANGEDALRLLARHKFDIVVCDLRLPDRWGDEVLAHVAARCPSTRRLLLTADPSPERAVSELLAVGVIQACFQKPRTAPLIEAILK